MDAYLRKIEGLLGEHPQGLSVSEIATEIGLNRNSTARYLDVLHHQGVIDERKIGPAKLYILTKTLPFSTQLDLFKKAMDAASCGITIADVRKGDLPLIYANTAFEKLTGYTQEEVIGRNCRFLQGKDTNQEGLKQIRESINAKKDCVVTIKNYTKSGKLFHNKLRLSPIFDERGVLTHYVGIQTEVKK